MRIPTPGDIAYICKQIFETFGIQARPFDQDEIAAFLDGSAPADPPVIRTSDFLESFLIVRLPAGQQASAALVIGPSLFAVLPDKTALGVLNDNDVPNAKHAEWLRHYASLPVIDSMKLLHAGLLIHYLIHGEKLDIDAVLSHNLSRRPAGITADMIDISLSRRRENSLLHHDPAEEKDLMQHIRNGNKEEVLKAHASIQVHKLGTLSKRSHLRNRKNLAISAITLATRAAIDGGLLWEVAYTLSDLHIQHIEELKDISQVERALIEAFADFADRVRQNKERKGSGTVALCRNIIFNRLYEDITLEHLAAVTGLNASYLSQLFKKEVGTPVSEYIQRERIEEAKKLLELTDMPLADIGARLQFNDQSYFTKVFKKHAGMTPKQFRSSRNSAAAKRHNKDRQPVASTRE
ncbi:AraC family transcriptional regulator [Paenibacillus darwinianus]|uniref:AraC family transcriptional regulator n=1 Tax=Paenibacillus darwinianus TaxID=1380763 RepID=A0A9W5S0N0_9BACL|nr:helix-turn-helix domain-containing protein [Paenibacillus darwinianus]EXX86766.1 AraC family transcriptional regulator [Paenibacillus darwinianus]EXX87078.1 AraC family transcriptional regulator [Paenibacillus darwinianus]EXX87284.1 AraC family transcriptional regulator [Paenibacillus darwinianus]